MGAGGTGEDWRDSFALAGTVTECWLSHLFLELKRHSGLRAGPLLETPP